MSNEDTKKLNKFEIELQQRLSTIMKDEKKKFTAFLHVLVDGVPMQGTKEFENFNKEEYLKINKKEYIKFIRSSFTVEEIYKMLVVVNYELVFTLDNKQINIDDYIIKDEDNSKIRLKFVDLMASCALLGIEINCHKASMQDIIDTDVTAN